MTNKFITVGHSEAWNLIVVVVSNHKTFLALPEHIEHCLFIIKT